MSPQKIDTADGLIAMPELCKLTALSKHYFYEMISERRLPFPVYKFGRAVRFKRAEVDAWIESQKVRFDR